MFFSLVKEINRLICKGSIVLISKFDIGKTDALKTSIN